MRRAKFLPTFMSHAPTDTVTIAFVIATITAVAVVASWLPAWRASRVDPNIVLRDE